MSPAPEDCASIVVAECVNAEIITDGNCIIISITVIDDIATGPSELIEFVISRFEREKSAD